MGHGFLCAVNESIAEILTEYNILVARAAGTRPSGGEVMGAKALKVLVSGASFAGLSTAFWMSRLGCQVTVVEVARGLRAGGTAVDIKGNTVDIVRRMGLLEQIRSNRL